MKNSNVVIVIPVHSSTPSDYELISFQQCFNILGSHPIKVIAPEGLSLTAYNLVVTNFETIFINTKWQSSLLNYNKLKLSRFFYSLFEGYEYLLTYELDAFVFRDELIQWCNQGYDYIGAPWFEGYSNATGESNITGVGNSGFSLRKISTINKILKDYYYQPSIKEGRVKYMISLLLLPFFYIANNFKENISIQKNYNWYEDYFFCKVVPLKYSFEIAPLYKAISFSFESNPSILYKLNNKQLPMGCHAWWRYDFKFWRPFIEEYNYTLEKVKA